MSKMEASALPQQGFSHKKWHAVILLTTIFSLWIQSSTLRRGQQSAAAATAATATIYRSQQHTTTHTPFAAAGSMQHSNEASSYLSQLTESFATCAINDDCHILYWHVQKTGGTYISHRLYSMNEENYNSKEWCCFSSFMERFQEDPLAYCQKKFGVYEVRAEEYREVVETCRKMLPQNHTFLGFVSIRQPLERTVSAIHQRCNKRTGRLDQKQRDICARCDYTIEEDQPFYNEYVDQTNAIFTGLESLLTNPSLASTPLWILDNADINSFFESLEQVATQQLRDSEIILHNETFRFPETKRTNAQDQTKHKVCDFGMTSSMMKDLASSLRMHRWILERMALAGKFWGSLS